MSIPEGLSYKEFRDAVRRAVNEILAERVSPLGAAGSDGSETVATSSGLASVPRRPSDFIQRCIVTARQLSGGGSVSDPASPGEVVEYKVKVLDTGLETGWLVPMRHIDAVTIGYSLAAVNSFGYLHRFPKGNGTHEVKLELITDPEQIAGAACEEAEAEES